MKKENILLGNFLNQVIFRIDFSRPIKLFDDDEYYLKKFKQQILNSFPNSERVPRNKFNLDIDLNSGRPKKLTAEGELGLLFKSEDNKKEVSLTSNELILDYKKGSYIQFRYFLDDVLMLINALKIFQNIELKFLGLRYINQINNPLINHNIDRFIDESLYGNIITDNLNDDEEIIQVFTKLNIKKKDYLFTLQYGFFNPKFPNPNENNEFILDYDCVTNKIRSLDEIKRYLIEMNHLIYNQFNNSITEEFEEFMKK